MEDKRKGGKKENTDIKRNFFFHLYFDYHLNFFILQQQFAYFTTYFFLYFFTSHSLVLDS